MLPNRHHRRMAFPLSGISHAHSVFLANHNSFRGPDGEKASAQDDVGCGEKVIASISSGFKLDSRVEGIVLHNKVTSIHPLCRTGLKLILQSCKEQINLVPTERRNLT